MYVWEKSTFQIRQNYPAPVGFLPEPDFCRIWKKCRISGRSRSWNLVLPYKNTQIKNTHNTETKHNPEKANNVKKLTLV